MSDTTNTLNVGQDQLLVDKDTPKLHCLTPVRAPQLPAFQFTGSLANLPHGFSEVEILQVLNNVHFSRIGDSHFSNQGRLAIPGDWVIRGTTDEVFMVSDEVKKTIYREITI